MPSLGAGEIIVIFVLVLVLFGPNRLPELARGLGKTVREVRKMTSEFQSQLAAITDIDDDKPTRPAAVEPVTLATSPPRLDQMSSTSKQWAPPEDPEPADQPSDFSDATPDATTTQGTLPFAEEPHLASSANGTDESGRPGASHV